MMLSQRLRTLVLKRIWELKLTPAEVVALTGISKEIVASLALSSQLPSDVLTNLAMAMQVSEELPLMAVDPHLALTGAVRNEQRLWLIKKMQRRQRKLFEQVHAVQHRSYEIANRSHELLTSKDELLARIRSELDQFKVS